MGITPEDQVMNGYTRAHSDYYPHEYLAGIELFNARKYYEAHEAWEDIWRVSQGERKLYLQGLIQAAAALLHFDRNNRRGAYLCANNSLNKLERLTPEFMSLDLNLFTANLRAFLADVLTDEAPAIMNDVPAPRPMIELMPLILEPQW
jgi:predicted metal-dependent hydrolase